MKSNALSACIRGFFVVSSMFAIGAAYAVPGALVPSAAAVTPVALPVSTPAVPQRVESSNSPVFRFNLSSGLSLSALEIEGSRKVEPEPDSTSYEGDPLKGSFQSNGLLFVRTVESVALPLGGEREWTIGAGIEAASSLGDFGRFSRKSAAPFSLQIWSVCMESGLRRRLAEGQGVEILFGGAYSLGGKAGFSYKGQGDDGSQATEVFDDRIGSAWKASLMGRYSFRFLSFLEAGVAIEGYYGRIDFSSRNNPTAIQGSALHALFAFAID